MKRLRITTKPGRKKRYDLFNSVEALYVLISDNISIEKFIAENHDCVTTIDLNDDQQYLEIEWMGCEFIKNTPIHYVRAVRISSGRSLAIYSGWISKDLLQFCDLDLEDVTQRRIDNDCTIDMSILFEDDVQPV